MNNKNKWYKEPFMLGVGALFSIVFLVNVLFVYFALDSWTGVVTENPYSKGLNFNDRIVAQQKQDALAWKVQLEVLNLNRGIPELVISFQDKQGILLSFLTVKTKIFRPVGDGYDQSIILKEQTPGIYRGILNLPLPGWWELQIEAHNSQDIFRHTQRIQVGESNSTKEKKR